MEAKAKDARRWAEDVTWSKVRRLADFKKRKKKKS